MKIFKTVTLLLCLTAFSASLALAAETPKSCCDKAKAKGEECKHKCCLEAQKDKKTCEKCNPVKK